METNKKRDEQTQNTSESTPEGDDQAGTSMSRRTLLKTTVAASAAASLSILGMEEPEVRAQTGAENQDDRALRAYFQRGYNYFDAKVLGGYWNLSAGEAKVNMGHKLLNTRSDDAITQLRAARGYALERATVNRGPGFGSLIFDENINYEDGGYSYNDVDVLSTYWNQNTIQTKFAMETMLIAGKGNELMAELNNAKR